ncbi:MAG: GntR family transcriptional regulator [Firmicutes bacterium HGW-Firmicutes-15]|nr:MAG: GntR family transcriptional regulator [Firmicutes bacterium HGW-Firmicutes-15]
MNIIIANSSPDPIYEQICQQIKNAIVKGELTPGDLLPSIRNLARELRISVITSKRAYEELEREGFIETVGGKGTFVSLHNTELLREKRMQLIEEKLTETVMESKILDISLATLHEMLDLLYKEV